MQLSKKLEQVVNAHGAAIGAEWKLEKKVQLSKKVRKAARLKENSVQSSHTEAQAFSLCEPSGSAYRTRDSLLCTLAPNDQSC